jgi:ketosteroid isomerase-like protein
VSEPAELRLVERFYGAINGGEIDLAIGLLSEDVRWSRPPDVPVTGTLEGTEAVRKMWRAFAGALERFEIEPTRLDLHGDQVLARITIRGEGPDGAGPFEFAGAQVFRIRDGAIGEALEFRSIPEAEAALD